MSYNKKIEDCGGLWTSIYYYLNRFPIWCLLLYQLMNLRDFIKNNKIGFFFILLSIFHLLLPPIFLFIWLNFAQDRDYGTSSEEQTHFIAVKITQTFFLNHCVPPWWQLCYLLRAFQLFLFRYFSPIFFFMFPHSPPFFLFFFT